MVNEGAPVIYLIYGEYKLNEDDSFVSVTGDIKSDKVTNIAFGSINDMSLDQSINQKQAQAFLQGFNTTAYQGNCCSKQCDYAKYFVADD
ncbi:serine protease pet autotransporter domain protein [Providencia alcalifaciens R90-1475]|nr:serine protease pet autotransporter domain protein [Providencia alcalifaciens R90-1475]